MKKIVEKIEKMKPTFEKISNNPYLRAVRDGFISLIPVILFSSIFLLIAYVPNIFNFYWSATTESSLMKIYDASMGILGLLMSATVAKSLTDNFNNKLPKTNQINPTSVMIASIVGFILIGVNFIDGGLAIEYMGTKGLITAFVTGFITPNIYKFCVKNNITIKMPEEVPGNIAQTFKDLVPITLSTVFFWLFDLIFRFLIHTSFSEKIIEVFQPIFNAADGYLGLALVFGAMAFFWFVGIHGPSIVEPAVSAIYISNVAINLELYQHGQHADKILSQGTQYFVATLGGTGATLVITLMFAFMAKSKQLKTIGKASAVPVLFGVNEPILFGAPMVLNPVFFIPFILTPIINVWIFKFFVDVLKMNGFIYNLPWTTPGPLGLILGTGFALLSVVLMVVLLVVDFIIYYPFFKVYDSELLEAESKENNMSNTNSATQQEKTALIKPKKHLDVLVLCANGATSSMLANSIKKGALLRDIDLDSTAMAYGQHKDIINDFDLIILAPQMASMLPELLSDIEDSNTKGISTTGSEYISLTKEPENAVAFVISNISKEEE